MKKSTTQIRIFSVSLTALLVLAACNGSDTTGVDTSVSAPAATDATTTSTDPERSTTLLPPQVTAETSPPPVTGEVTTPTVATTTTVEPITVEEAVAAGAIAATDAYEYAVYNLDAPDALDRLRATTTGDSLTLGLENYQQLVDNGWLVKPNPDVPDRVTIASAVEIIDDTTAEVTICNADAGVVYAPGAADDGSDVIINNLVSVQLLRVTMVVEDATWKLTSGTTIEELIDPTACDEF